MPNHTCLGHYCSGCGTSWRFENAEYGCNNIATFDGPITRCSGRSTVTCPNCERTMWAEHSFLRTLTPVRINSFEAPPPRMPSLNDYVFAVMTQPGVAWNSGGNSPMAMTVQAQRTQCSCAACGRYR